MKGVRGCFCESHPRKTVAQSGSIAVHELVDLFGMRRSEGLQAEIVTDFKGYDGGDGVHRADYTLGLGGDLDSLSGLKKSRGWLVKPRTSGVRHDSRSHLECNLARHLSDLRGPALLASR